MVCNMKNTALLFSLFCVLFLWNACGNEKAPGSDTKEVAETKEFSLSLRETADSVMRSIKRTDMMALSAFMVPKGSILFSPYSYVDTVSAMRLSANDLRDFFGDTTRATWGAYDGSGLPIVLSCADYYKTFIYNQSFAEADSVIENKSIQRGNSMDNLATVFPDNEHVEYFIAGDAKQDGLGWGSLTLVFRKEGQRYVLVGIVNNRWTI